MARGQPSPCSKPDLASLHASAVPGTCAAPMASIHSNGGVVGPKSPVPCMMTGLQPRASRHTTRGGPVGGPARPVGVPPRVSGKSVGVSHTSAPSARCHAPGGGTAAASCGESPTISGARGGLPHSWPRCPCAAGVGPSTASHASGRAGPLGRCARRYDYRPRRVRTGGPVLTRLVALVQQEVG